jgi:hypothetical protein
MNMPGFTAEASLYESGDHRQIARTFSHLEGTIQPAVRRSNCYRDCLTNCDDDPYYCSVNCNCFCKGGPPLCQYQ